MRYTRGFVAIYVAAAAASAPRWVLRPAADNISVGSTGANQTSSGVCWDEWNQYWSASLRATETSYEVDYSTLTTTLGTGVHTFEIGSTRTILPSGFYSYEEVTYTVITTRIEYEATPKTGYETRLTTQTETLREGPSIIGTQTYTYTMPDLGLSFFPSTRTFTEVFTSATATDPLITPPPCALPSIVPQCQSSWDSYGSAMSPGPDCLAQCYFNSPPPPVCTQASLAAGACSGLVSSYFHEQSWRGYHLFHGNFGYETTVLPDGSQSVFWPTHTTFGPSCTLGCAQCQLRGNAVQLIYWPPVGNGSLEASGTEPVTAVAFGTTFTSPTAYISFDKLYASDSCTLVGATYSDIILPIPNTESISSLYGFGGSASFNFSDLLQTPVPYSIFTSQPWCAEHLYEGGVMATCDTSRYPYAPALKIPDPVRDLDPRWASCVGGIEGVYDPPYALTAATAVAKPTVPGHHTTPATPGSHLPTIIQSTGQPWPTPTAIPVEDPGHASNVQNQPNLATSSPSPVNNPNNGASPPPQHETDPGEGLPSADSVSILISAQTSLDANQPASGVPDPRESSGTNSPSFSPQNSDPTDAPGPQSFKPGLQISPISIGPAAVIADGVTVIPGDAPATISGHMISAGSAFLVIDGTTIPEPSGTTIIESGTEPTDSTRASTASAAGCTRAQEWRLLFVLPAVYWIWEIIT